MFLYLKKKKTKYKRPKLVKSPQRRGMVLRLRVCTPRKPNSARRPTVKAWISTKKKLLAKIPGSGHNLRRHSKILIRGNGYRDVPVVNYTCIRGKLDFEPLYLAKTRRSIYGVPLLKTPESHIRRKFRNLQIC